MLAGSLVGSYFDIPVATWPGRQVVAHEAIPFFGMRYVVPVVLNAPGTILAVNVGGAVIPGLVSLYLLLVNAPVVWAVLAIAGAVTHGLAQPVGGRGIPLPVFVPAIATAITALVLSVRHAAPLASIGGSMGTLLGAGTFDCICLTGVLAVLMASIPAGLLAPRPPSR